MVKITVEKSTNQTVVKSVVDSTIEGYDAAYKKAAPTPPTDPDEGGDGGYAARASSLDDPKSCTD